MFHVTLMRICILLLFDEVLYIKMSVRSIWFIMFSGKLYSYTALHWPLYYYCLYPQYFSFSEVCSVCYFNFCLINIMEYLSLSPLNQSASLYLKLVHYTRHIVVYIFNPFWQSLFLIFIFRPYTFKENIYSIGLMFSIFINVLSSLHIFFLFIILLMYSLVLIENFMILINLLLAY